MRTASFTARDNTTLTIETDEVVDLVRMGQEDPFARLEPGKNVVTAPKGVFKVVSKRRVGVTSDAADAKVVATPAGKGGWPDPPLALARAMGAEPDAVMQFLVDEKSEIVE
jgi:hypothetical protein